MPILETVTFRNYHRVLCYTILLLLFSLYVPCSTLAQAVPDTLFDPMIKDPAWPLGKGPEIKIDAAHNNYHTASFRYAPFALALREDGYSVRENNLPFDASSLKSTPLLVISNAINASNLDSWALPTPSAFSADEIIFLNEWVKNGGRLLLIADHMPFSGAARDLAASFGFSMCNCFAMDNLHRRRELFCRANQSLLPNEITNGSGNEQYTDSIYTFTGSGFKIPQEAIPILKLIDYTMLSPVEAWKFDESTPKENSDEYYQGAALKYGKGKLVIMGEAAMFSAQLAANQKFGMNSPEAVYNVRLLRNIIQWLLKDK